MSDELLPCPFCGGAAVHNMGHLSDGSPWPYVECLYCTACAEPEMWNRRASQSQEIARLTERCDAYLGQVKAGDEQILALRSRAKEMQREKAELTERCDAYREVVDAARNAAGRWRDAIDRSEDDVMRVLDTMEDQMCFIKLEKALAALATLPDKTP